MSVRLKSCKKMVICVIIGCSNRSERDKVQFLAFLPLCMTRGSDALYHHPAALRMAEGSFETRFSWRKIKNTFLFVRSIL